MRKMIIRIDDIGFTDFCNIGSFETIERGYATSADVMLDSPGTVDALRRLRSFPWISVGWHTHMWGTPALEGAKVPSLIEKEGAFKGRFREDLANASDVDFDEARAEQKAQLDRCIQILGRVPDTTSMPNSDSPWACAMKVTINEYAIVCNFSAKKAMDPRVVEKINQGRAKGEQWADLYTINLDATDSLPDAKWAERKILTGDGSLAYIDLYTPSLDEQEEKYDPVLYYTEDRAGILDLPEDVIFSQSWHPGYIDYYVARLGERSRRPRARQFVVCRAKDVYALCSTELHDWIKTNKIELVNFRDALYGSREYQNHLRATGNDLAINF
jgi:predicted glycoside hydrolase/deacetylase ChbG (UPF0249 family)